MRRVPAVPIFNPIVLCTGLAILGAAGALAAEPETLRVYVAVSASTDAAEAGILSGWSDAPLNESGRQQARAMVALLPSELAGVYTSSLSRAIETAQLATGRFTLTSVPDLRPRNIGPFVGTAFDDALFVGRKMRPDDDLGGAETLTEYRSRLRKAVAAIRERQHTGTILLVVHRSTFADIVAALAGTEIQAVPRAGDLFVTRLQSDGRMQIEALTSTQPLQAP